MIYFRPLFMSVDFLTDAEIFRYESYECARSKHLTDLSIARHFDEMTQFTLMPPIEQIYDILINSRNSSEIPIAILTIILENIFKITPKILKKSRSYFQGMGRYWENVYAHISSGKDPNITALYIYMYRDQLGGILGIKLIQESITNYLDLINNTNQKLLPVEIAFIETMKELKYVLDDIIPEIIGEM